ncbi:MAG: hypothetical protein KME20_03675 [Kaiparowitsia implicata GSE-PSE-MK54-09C]|jgi:hypothetical protein|nr:hypothetical protein [Kaiparowitsia implicata GSE-PSE-MK54-09C]
MNTKILPAFQALLAATFSITILAGGAYLWSASQDPLASEQTRMTDVFEEIMQTGVTTIVGLLGGNGLLLVMLKNDDVEKKV